MDCLHAACSRIAIRKYVCSSKRNAGGLAAVQQLTSPVADVFTRSGGRTSTVGFQAAGLEESPPLARGHIYFVPAGTALEVAADSGVPGDDGLLLWVCAVNSRVYAQALPVHPSLGLPRQSELEGAITAAAQDIGSRVPASA